MLVSIQHNMRVNIQHNFACICTTLYACICTAQNAWNCPEQRPLYMPKPNEKLAESLAALHQLQKGGRRVFRSDDLSRTHRERLLQNGFLQEVMKGWVISSSPSARA